MGKRWMWIVCLTAAAVLATGGAALFAKSGEDDGKGEAKVTGSVAIPSDEARLAGMAKVSLVEAVGAAVKSTPGKAIAAELEDEDGFLVYAVDIVTADNKVMEVTVDAGNKKILKTEAADEDENGEDEEGEDEEGEHEGKGKKDVRGED